VLGVALIPLQDSIGAAIAAVVAESVLAGLLLLFLARGRSLTPPLAFLLRLLAAATVLVVAALLPLPTTAVVLLGSALYTLAIVASGILPGEVLDALRSR
jgi:hypothetical protein